MLLLERIIGEAKIVESDRTKLPSGVLCRVKEPVCNVNKLNANNRKYGWDVVEKVTGDKTLSEQIAKRALFGHAEHPTTSQSNLELVSHVICEWVVDKDTDTVYQVFDVLDTPTGRIVDCLIRAECGVGVSTRAEGELTEEVDPDTKKKFHRVVAEKYKYITTDFTADPSTFGTMPIEVKRNVVESIKTAALCEKATKGDKQFAGAVLESMLCKHSKDEKHGKCEQCGCCKAIKEATMTIIADPNAKTAEVNGDVNNVGVTPASTDPTVNQTPVVVTISTQPPTPQPVAGTPEFATPDRLEAEADEVVPEEPKPEAEVDEPDEDEDEVGENKKTAGRRKISEEVEILQADQAEVRDATNLSVNKRLTGGKLEAIRKILGEPTYPDGDKTGDKTDSQMTWVGVADGKLFSVNVVSGDDGPATVISANEPETVEAVVEFMNLEHQWAQPATEKVPNEKKTKTASATLKEMNKLRIENATLMAERDRLAEAVDIAGDTGLQLKVVMRKLQEAKKVEGAEVTALRAKLEERAAAAANATKKLEEAATHIKTLTEKVVELTVGKERILKENKQKIEGVEKDGKKALDEQVKKAQADATRTVIMEYAERKLKGFKSVHDNVRALLEGCKTIAEVDEVLEDTRESMRKNALHSNAPKEVTVREAKTGSEDVRKRIGNAFTGMQMG